MMRNCGAAALCLGAAAAAVAVTKPNILMLITDDQDAHLGSLDVMPNTQRRFFDEGMSFTNAFVASPVCCPSRTALFSGRMPHNIGDTTMGWCGNFSANRENTFMASLKSAGYTMAQIGKWYNEEPDFCKEGYMPVWKTTQADQFYVMCQEVKYYNMTWNDNGKLTATGDAPEDYLTSVIGNRTMQWLNNATQSSQPWMAYVAVHAPHLPATPAPWYANASLPGDKAPRTPNYNFGWQDKHWEIDNGIDKPMDKVRQDATDALWASRLRTLMSVDDLVHDIFQLLEARGQLSNTVLFFTSDHGYHAGQWGIWAEKANPYDFDSNVPLAVRGPGIPAGSVSNALVTNIDLPPTFLELAGVPDQWPDGSGRRDGRSIVPLLNAASAAAAAGSATAGDAVAATSAPAPVPIPAGWRDRLVIEFIGWESWQWLAPCQFNLTPGPCGADQHAGMTNAASNCYTSLRVVNETHNTLYAEYRKQFSPLSHASTNFTEAYNLTSDFYQITNLAVGNRLPAGVIAQMSAELWQYANCIGEACP